jgi:hypothetical protein
MILLSGQLHYNHFLTPQEKKEADGAINRSISLFLLLCDTAFEGHCSGAVDLSEFVL